MQKVAIIGVGQIPVGEHWNQSIRDIGSEAVKRALSDAGLAKIDALYVGNAYGSSISSQSQLGALLADYSGLGPVEAVTIEAGDASGGAALRAGYLAVASGAVDSVVVLGVEKATDMIGASRIKARAVSLDADVEAIQGATLPALAALLMRRYMHETGTSLSSFEGFSINAHANGKRNTNAMYRNTIKPGSFAKSPMVADPVGLFDMAPDADGAAAVVLVSAERAKDLVPQPVEICGSAAATDTLALQERSEPLFLPAVAHSTRRALGQAGLSLQNISLFELHDAFTILSVLALEAAGFAARGEGWKLARDEVIGLKGSLPISTFGGLKSRGNPAGATGVYQAVEATLQLRHTAGENQVSDPRHALIQSIGGIGSTVVTHVLRQLNGF